MTREHLATFLWLRWRLLVNQARRAGTVSAVVTAVLAVIGLVASGTLFVAGVALGAFGMPELPASVRLFIWTGTIAFFLFFWLTGLLTALQRSEALSIEKVLHLPVSPAGAFLVNYLSSFVSVSLILFVPGMTGLAIGQVWSMGSSVLLGFPLLAAFVFAMTALTYQFQGWLSSLVSNPRRRRTVVTLVTVCLVALVQLPNLLNLLRPWDTAPAKSGPFSDPETQKLVQKLQSGKLSEKQFKELSEKRTRYEREEKDATTMAALNRAAAACRLVCGVLPPGWVALGMADLMEGRILSALLGTIGLDLIGVWSLMRACRTTLRMYTRGGPGGGGHARSTTPTAAAAIDRPRLAEWRLPFVPEPAAAVAAAGLRSILRAPEAKMLLLTPLLIIVVFGAGFSTFRRASLFGPFVMIGTIMTFLMSMTHFVSNIFGFDRDGFRAFVLSPVPRREILLGKNLAYAPLFLSLGAVLVTVAGIVVGLSADHFLAAYIQFVIMYLLTCLLGNACSIWAPFVVPAGSLKRARPSFSVLLVQLAAAFLSPAVVALPAALPLLLETLFTEGVGLKDVPISLVGSVVVLAATVWIYRWVLTWEGRLLTVNEQRILEVVSRKAE